MKVSKLGILTHFVAKEKAEYGRQKLVKKSGKVQKVLNLSCKGNKAETNKEKKEVNLSRR